MMTSLERFGLRVLAIGFVVLVALFALLACTPGARSGFATGIDAAAGSCKLVPVFAGESSGTALAAVLCEGIAALVSGVLRGIPASNNASVQACVMVPLNRQGGDPRELVCKARRGDVLRAIGGAR